GALAEAITAARPAQDLSFVDKLKQMFSVDIPAAVDSNLVSETMLQWKTFWMLPAIMAGVIAVVFFLGFWDKSADTADLDESEKTPEDSTSESIAQPETAEA
ncbi:MAG: hypothetical protein NE327_15745, partial [Lentisphaeraceae bacterium]|nr:hypothetical protein [Lentisphaeraceae bacterium]